MTDDEDPFAPDPPPPPPEPPHDDTRDRLPPQDVDAERSVLGAMLLSRDAITDVAAVLTDADFYRPAHALIYDAALALHDRGQPADAVTVAAELTRRGNLQQAGGSTALHTLTDAVMTAANAGYYADIVRERAVLRRIVEAGTKVVQLGYGDGAADDIAERARQEIATATRSRTGGAEQRAADLLEAAHHAIDPETPRPADGIEWPWNELNFTVNPMTGGQLIVIAARPAVGKSVVGLDLIRHVAIRLGETACLVSLEMGREQIMARLLAAEARVSLTKIRRRELEEDDWRHVAQAHQRVEAAPAWIDDTPDAGIGHIRALVRRRRPKVLILDYLQLAQMGKADSRQQAVADFTRQLKLLAKAEDITIVALSQLNRGPEQRADKRPMLSDLRESGALEQDADVVMLLHRDDVHDKTSARAGEMDVIVAKQRDGATGTAVLSFQGHYSRAVSMGAWMT